MGHPDRRRSRQTTPDDTVVVPASFPPQLRTHCGGDDARVNLLLNNNGFLKMITPPEKLFYRQINTTPLFEVNEEVMDRIEGYCGIYE